MFIHCRPGLHLKFLCYKKKWECWKKLKQPQGKEANLLQKTRKHQKQSQDLQDITTYKWMECLKKQ